MMTPPETFVTLWAYCTDRDRAIPYPHNWHQLYEMLTGRRRNLSGGWEPPLPLILAAWHDSTPLDKQLRFKEHIEWAENHNQLDEVGLFLRSLPEEKWYHFEELPSGDGVYYGFFGWDTEPKERPRDDEVAASLEKLKECWLEIAGVELAKNTEPIGFTGKKRRRLVVRANANHQPPWGSWNSLAWGNRRAFTQFRRTVNYLIAPLEVDHIDFDVSIPKPRFTAITPDMSEEQMLNNLNATLKKIGFNVEEDDKC